MNVLDLERALFECFPKEEAEAWDHVGLSVGDPADEVRVVAVALDATAVEVRAAHELGANVLVTHHPVYISAPDAFTPEAPARASAGAAVYEAVRLGVSVISLHTNLDRSHDARTVLPALVGFQAYTSLEFPTEPTRTGLGALAEGDPRGLSEFALQLADAFGTHPQVWGDPACAVSRVAFLGGSLGDFGELALAAGADAVVTGEAGYHRARDLSLRGLAVITLGHDRSEQPFCEVLARSVHRAGIPRDSISIIDPPAQWWVPTRQGGTL